MLHAALALWMLSAAVCWGAVHQHEGYDPQRPDPDVASLVTAANKQFAFQLYRQLSAHADSQGKNIFFSPVSVSVALAALSAGARGETRRQLFSGLGFNATQLSQAELDQAFGTLLDRAKKASDEVAADGVAVFLDQGFSPRPEFLETLTQSYAADGFVVDFNQTTDSANTINTYVKEKTGGKIDKLVSNLDPNTVMYLISYIYFKGKWEVPFDAELTKEDTFMVDENTRVPVKMMNMEHTSDTYYDHSINTSVLHLPFNSSHSMLLLLPDDMATLEKVICPSHVAKWMKWMKSRKYNIFIPKFSIKTSYSLEDALTRLGMTAMFGGGADFSGIAEGQNLTVSEVVHQATLDIDEAGATAAAATGVLFTPLSFVIVPVLKFDRPFMVIITESSTDNILFMGKIVNPAQAE